MIDEIINASLRGYTYEQYSEAIVETLTQFLISKGIIQSREAKEFLKIIIDKY